MSFSANSLTNLLFILLPLLGGYLIVFTPPRNYRTARERAQEVFFNAALRAIVLVLVSWSLLTFFGANKVQTWVAIGVCHESVFLPDTATEKYDAKSPGSLNIRFDKKREGYHSSRENCIGRAHTIVAFSPLILAGIYILFVSFPIHAYRTADKLLSAVKNPIYKKALTLIKQRCHYPMLNLQAAHLEEILKKNELDWMIYRSFTETKLLFVE